MQNETEKEDMNKADEFIQKYKELEKIARSEFNIPNMDSVSYKLRNTSPYKKYASDIEYCTEVRNLLQHKEKIGASFAVDPSDEMLKFIDRIISMLKNRNRCSDICIKAESIYSGTMDSSVKELVSQMRKNTYTHVPIVENGVVIGVFDENALFNYAADQEIISIEDGIKVRDIAEYISIEDRESEEFIFVMGTEYVDNLQCIFSEYLEKGKRIGVAFVTTNGRENGNLCGLITSWDVVGRVD